MNLTSMLLAAGMGVLTALAIVLLIVISMVHRGPR